MGEAEAGSDIDLRSRPGLALRASRRGLNVATSFFKSRPRFWCCNLEIPLWAEMRSRHGIDVATWVSLQGHATWVMTWPVEVVSRPRFEVRDLVCFVWAETVSRPRFKVATWFSLLRVATWIWVATEAGCLGMSRPVRAPSSAHARATEKLCITYGMFVYDLIWNVYLALPMNALTWYVKKKFSFFFSVCE